MKIFVFIIISLIIIDFFYKGNDGWQLDSWKELKKQIVEEYNFIEEIEIHGTSPTLIITFTIDEKVPLRTIESIFEKTKKFLFSEEVFPELIEYHHELYGGTTMEIHIIFTYTKEDDPYYYDFYSHKKESGVPKSTSFETWYIEYDNVKREYTPVEE